MRNILEKYRAKAFLTQAGRTDYEKKYMIPILPVDFLERIDRPNVLKERGNRFGLNIRSLGDYYQYMELQLDKWVKEERVIGLKAVSNPFREPPSSVKAEK